MEKPQAPLPTLPKKSLYDPKYFNSFISGGLAGIVAKSVIAPLDRIKILFQTTSRVFTYRNAINEAMFIYQQQGLKGMWRGNFATAVRVFPYAAIQFAAFDFFQNLFYKPEHTYLEKNFFNFVSGSLTGVIATSITYPAEFIRTRMAIERENIMHKTFLDAIRNIRKKEGLRAFYNGMGPSVLGIIPYHGTGFFMYHLLKGNLKQKHPEWKQSKAFDFIFGAIAGLCAQLVSYPFDMVRKKMQVQTVLLERGDITKKKGILRWVRYIVRTEGIRGMYKGITMNVVKGPLATGTSFMVKNILNRKLDKSYNM